MNTDRIILGIDPGTNILGYGLIQNKSTKITLIKMGIIHLAKYKDHASKLKIIFERILAIIEEYKPDEMAIEAPFYGKNVQSMLKLGRAQGVAMASALYRDIPIFEYAPRKIKQSITGNGNASKEQVAGMLSNLINIDKNPKYLDETDGVAVAVCHYFQGNQLSNGKHYNNWKNFIAENPQRIK